MCRKHALAATTVAVLTVFAQPAFAFGWGRGEKAEAKAPAAAAKAPPQAAASRATPQERAMADRLDPLARSAFWAREFGANPTDADAGLKLAAALRAIGRAEEATQTAQQVLVMQPSNVEALMEAARGYIAQNQGFYAIDPARRAQTLAPRDWRPASILAVALEQAQRDDEALVAHRQALALAPGNPVVLSNVAMYYAGHGDAAQAEALLRRAAADPAAPIQVRQNLALVLGLQGKLAEAEQLARRDLPPQAVANNLAYLRAASGGGDASRTWNSMR